MILGIVGDTHNNLKNISKICEIFNNENTDLVLHTGDITLPKSLHAFNSLNCKIHAVFGNNDIEEKESLKKVAENMNCTLSEEPYFFKLEGVSICLIHHPELIDTNLLERSDIILHGHTHRYRNEMIRNTKRENEKILKFHFLSLAFCGCVFTQSELQRQLGTLRGVTHGVSDPLSSLHY